MKLRDGRGLSVSRGLLDASQDLTKGQGRCQRIERAFNVVPCEARDLAAPASREPVVT